IDSSTVSRTIASSENFNALGSAPGISDDGNIVVFYGDLSTDGAATINSGQLGMPTLYGGPGIFASIATISGQRLVRISGSDQNSLLDRGERFVDTNSNGRFDVGETQIGPRSFAADLRVAVNSTQVSQQAVSVIFEGFDAGGKLSLYASRLNFVAKTKGA